MLRGVKAYNPVELAIWGHGEATPYLHVARALKAMDGTTKRLIISDVIANMFRSLLALSPGMVPPPPNPSLPPNLSTQFCACNVA